MEVISEKSTPEDATDYNDAYVKQLQKFIKKVKRSREMERQYMLFEDMIRWERKEAEEKGRQEGIQEGIQEGKLQNCRENIFGFLKDVAPVSETLNAQIMSEKNIDVLKQMLKLAAKADTMEEFEEAVSNL